MDNLTRNQIIMHYLKQFCFALKTQNNIQSHFVNAFFTSEELQDIRVYFKYSNDAKISDADVLEYLLYTWNLQKERSENPDEVFLEKVTSQLGLYGHYLSTKPIENWDEYDHSNFNTLKVKSGKSAYGYGVFLKNVSSEEVQTVDSKPLRWFYDLQLAESKKEEMILTGNFNEDELVIHQDLRPL